ncbi:hypothetical protein [Dyella sp.]|uniref:hypothetical protein n=1 Tax=Dyella sp. TaxID=1869338 RepID=UPI002ED4BA96
MTPPVQGRQHVLGLENIGFIVLTFVVVLVTHAIAYLTHEYAHSITAWTLGWMSRPFGIDYGHATLGNLVFLGDVSDNVDYEPIFASGHGWMAAAIALAGPFLGNGVVYILLQVLMSRSLVASRRHMSLFLYWLSLMCAANVWSYVPIRAITTHADIAWAARGLGVSTWVLFPFLMAISASITWHFFQHAFRKAHTILAGGSYVNLIVLVAFTGFWFFSFFGGDGMDGSYGTLSQVLSILSRYALFPLCVAYLAARYLDLRSMGGRADNVATSSSRS